MMKQNEAVDRQGWITNLAQSLYYRRGQRPSVDAFLDGVSARLATGEREYGNRSFARNPANVIQEILDETLDRAGWCYVLEGACLQQLAREDITTQERQRCMQLIEAARQISQDACDAYQRDSELLDTYTAPLDERDGGWTDAD